MAFGYATDRDAETWDEIDGATREEAAANAFRREAAIADAPDRLYICERQPVDKLPSLVNGFDLGIAEERAADDDALAPWFESDVYDHSPRAVKALTALLYEAFRQWLALYPGPAVWTAVNITEHARTEEPSL